MTSSLISEAFSFKLGYDVKPSCVAVGVLDGTHPHLVCAVPGGKVVVHNPFQARTEDRTDNHLLRFSQEVTAVMCGNIGQKGKSEGKDLVFVGTSSRISAYDYAQNTDVFALDAHDGCVCMCAGRLHSSRGAGTPLLYVGGSCSIYGFNAMGAEEFFTVTGDDVACMAVAPLSHRTNRELVAGVHDSVLKSFNADGDVVCDLPQAAVVTHVLPMFDNYIAFALSNGKVGVICDQKVLWEEQSKHHVNALAVYSTTKEYSNELIVGWSSGVVEIRHPKKGLVMSTETLKSPIAGIVVSDYRMEGRPSLICVTTDGRVVGYKAGQKTIQVLGSTPLVRENLSNKLRQLQQRRKDLKFKLNSLKQTTTKSKQDSSTHRKLMESELQISCTHHENSPALRLELSSGLPMTTVFIFNEGLFNEPVRAIHVTEPQTVFILPLPQAKCQEYHIEVHVFVGTHQRSKALVCKASIITPHYFPYKMQDVPEPNHMYTFNLTPQKSTEVTAWLNKSFVMLSPLQALSSPIGFRSGDGGLMFAAIGTHLIVGCDNLDVLDAVVRRLRGDVDLQLVDKPSDQARQQQAQADKTKAAERATIGNGSGGIGHSFNDDDDDDDDDDDGEDIDVDEEMEKSKSKANTNNNTDTLNTNIAALDKAQHPPRSNLKQQQTKQQTQLTTTTTGGSGDGSIGGILQSIKDLHAIRQRLITEIAEKSSICKGLLLRAEDFRMMGRLGDMMKSYKEVGDVNSDLMRSVLYRESNQNALKQSLRALNGCIMDSANKLDPSQRSAHVNACRMAIKQNNMEQLQQLLTSGPSLRTTSSNMQELDV